MSNRSKMSDEDLRLLTALKTYEGEKYLRTGGSVSLRTILKVRTYSPKSAVFTVQMNVKKPDGTAYITTTKRIFDFEFFKGEENLDIRMIHAFGRKFKSEAKLEKALNKALKKIPSAA